MHKKLILLTLFIWFIASSNAGRVDTIHIFSASMSLNLPAVVITPDTYKNKRLHFPVIYLLHGYSGNFSNWITRVPELANYADQYQLIIVCTEGGYGSWYFDSPIDKNMRYETYIGVEVPQTIDSTYRTIADNMHRAISGLSMGGHGALLIAWRHPDVFAFAGSMSGGVDLKESVHRFDIEKVLGDSVQYPGNWNNNSVMNIIETKIAQPISFILDCGTDDIFIAGNRRLHQKLLSLKIPHDYIERPGNHSWDYWKYSIGFQLLYFRKGFDMHPVN